MTKLKSIHATKPIHATNAHGCVVGRCRCPRSFTRCSLYTKWPQRHADPCEVVVGQTFATTWGSETVNAICGKSTPCPDHSKDPES